MEQTPEEYFQSLEQKARSRRGIFVTSTTAHRQTRQGRGTTPGPFQGYPADSEAKYDEAYGPPNLVRRGGGYTGSSASTYDEGLQARVNSRDDAREAEAKAKADPPKKKRKKK